MLPSVACDMAHTANFELKSVEPRTVTIVRQEDVDFPHGYLVSSR